MDCRTTCVVLNAFWNVSLDGCRHGLIVSLVTKGTGNYFDRKFVDKFISSEVLCLYVYFNKAMLFPGGV